jgi:hypothetical protein
MLYFDRSVEREKQRGARRRKTRSDQTSHTRSAPYAPIAPRKHRRRPQGSEEGIGALSAVILIVLLTAIGAWLVYDAGFARREKLVQRFTDHVAANWTRARADLSRARITLEVVDSRDPAAAALAAGQGTWPLPGAEAHFVASDAPGSVTGVELEGERDGGADVARFERLTYVLRQARPAPLLAPLTDWSGSAPLPAAAAAAAAAASAADLRAASSPDSIPAVVLRLHIVEEGARGGAVFSQQLETAPIALYRRIRRRPGNPNPQGRCRSWGGATGSKGRHDCQVFRVLSHVCLLLERDTSGGGSGGGGEAGGKWRLARGEGAPDGVHGCDPRLQWSPAQYDPARVVRGGKVPPVPKALDGVTFALRLAADPWLKQMALTDGAMHFGMAGSQQRSLGLGLLAAALVATLLAAYLCCAGAGAGVGVERDGRSSGSKGSSTQKQQQQQQQQQQRRRQQADAGRRAVADAMAGQQRKQQEVPPTGVAAAAPATATLPRPRADGASAAAAAGLAPGAAMIMSHENLALGAGAAAAAAAGPAVSSTARVVNAAKRLVLNLGTGEAAAGPMLLPLRASSGDDEHARLLADNDDSTSMRASSSIRKKQRKKNAVAPC